MKKVCAIDAGGTKIISAVVNENGEIISEIKKASTPKNINELTTLFKEIISEYENDVDYVAFATAGAVNRENTKVESSTPNMPEGYNGTDFSKLSNKPVYVENDANAAAWAEYKIGAAKNEDNTVTVTIGTGIGGGFISEGKLVRGNTGKGGEVGSMKIKSQGRICTCGRKDCWESYASGTGLKTTAEELARTDKLFDSSIYKNKKAEEITTYDIIKGVKSGDEYSEKVFEIWKEDLIRGLINITNIFNPESIIISGGLCGEIDVKEVEDSINKEIVVSPVKIKCASAGNNAGMTGAALLACEKFA